MPVASAPSTPSSKTNEEFNRLIYDLEQRWSLQLPVQDLTWSPAKNSNGPHDQQILSCIRFLFYKDRAALDISLGQFERHAGALHTNWLFKPQAEPDVLPSRTRYQSTRKEEALIAEVAASEQRSDELKECLLGNLKPVCDSVKQGKKYATEDTRGQYEGEHKQAESPKLPVLRYKASTPALRAVNELTGRNIVVQQNDINAETGPPKDQARSLHLPYGSSMRAKHSSSDDFPLGLDDFPDWTDIPMPDVPAPLERSDSSEQEYKTPPSEPSNDSNEKAMETDIMLRVPGQVPVQPPFRKKRPCPDSESLKPPTPRKTSNRSWSRVYTVNSVHPIGFIPSSNSQNQNADDQARISISTESDRSFGSTISLTTISTTTTTPATSFLDSMATSFESGLEREDETMKIPIESRMSNELADHGCYRASSEPLSHTQDQLAWQLSDLIEDRVEPPERPKMLSSAVSGRIGGLTCEQYLEKHLVLDSPMAKPAAHSTFNAPFRQRYEVERISRYCKIPQTCFIGSLERSFDGYSSLWSSLSTVAAKLQVTMPERGSLQAWSKAQGDFRNVSISGELQFAEQTGGPLFEFGLRPLKIDASYRLARKFGGDRIFTLSIPGLDADELPRHLKPFSAVIRDAIIRWIVDDDHYFVGRRWRAFYVKPEPHRKSGRAAASKSDQPRYRIFMFAEDGDDFRQRHVIGELDPRSSAHTSISVGEMIHWIMPAEHNRDQTVLKFFDRVRLSVSSTVPTVLFRRDEIIRRDDATAIDPRVWRLDLGRSQEKWVGGTSEKTKSVVMNDGCARISRAAANEIAEQLGLTQTPSVFQGRIGGAKGIWMIDALDEHLLSSDRDFWIEIADSQLKFEGHPQDEDDLRLTFEVHEYSRKISPSTLNFQFIPILVDRGVPHEVLRRLLQQDLMSKVTELKEAMSDPGSLRKWNQENNPVVGERLANNGIEMLAGLPNSLADQINWFLEHGFHPQKCLALKRCCYKAAHDYCTNLENRMHVGIGRSTSAFMIADPLAVLEEGEVHVGFSALFQDPKSGWSDVMLHDIDILVARSPALLPSDIQKVHGVFKPELRIYKDVIVFSSKGEKPLADKLSGGDYDGDKAWICWEPDIVRPFRNTSVPVAPPSKWYGIEESDLKVDDIIDNPDYLSQFLHHSFNFNLQPNLLGPCTVYHEALCYWKRSMHHPSAIAIAHLLGKLVDRAKAGFIYNRTNWNTFLRQNKLETFIKKPAYKNKSKEQPTNHIIDQLVFEVAAGVRECALKDLNTTFAHVGSWDDDLGRIWNIETQQAKPDEQLSAVREDLKSGLERIFSFWKDNVIERGDEFDMRIPAKKKSPMTFRALAEHCRSAFLTLQPLAGIRHPVVDRWRGETQGPADVGKSWKFIKASAVFCKYHNGKFAWYVAGPELGEIKAKAKGLGSYHTIVSGLYEFYKLDGKMLKRKRGRDEAAEQWNIDEKQSDYGSEIEDFGDWE